MLPQFEKNPSVYKSFKPTTAAVMQDFSVAKSYIFVTQAAKGPVPGTENVVISKISLSTGKAEKMVLVNAGHGIGIEAKYYDSRYYIFYSWGYRQHCRFIFKKGTFTFEQAMKLGGSVVYPRPNGDNEMLIKYDWDSGLMTCTRGEGADSVFYQRKIDEFRKGINAEYNHIRLSMGGDGTLQGFTGINGVFYRWLGAGGLNNTMSKTDPVILEAYNWSDGSRIFRKSYPNIGKDSKGHWPEGRCEPEGMTVLRESNGKASLLVGLNTGTAGSGKRWWKAFKFKEVGAKA